MEIGANIATTKSGRFCVLLHDGRTQSARGEDKVGVLARERNEFGSLWVAVL